MRKQDLEKYQVLIYITAILLGLTVGVSGLGSAPLFETLLWPFLGVLLYATFTQTSLSKIGWPSGTCDFCPQR